MFKFLCSAVLVLYGIGAHAQFVVSGRVSSDKEPLPGATVRLLENKSTTVTDASGRFSLPPVSAGTYTLQVSFIGFETLEKRVEVSESTDLNMTLKQTSIIGDEVVVRATRATDKTPTTFTNISKEAITKQNFGQDMPFLLNWIPSVTTTSDAGTGIGYTGIRIRGSDATRINVTINGVPYNDAESMNTFWVDIPDIASSTENVQIQRGVGTSTNGAAAFGATINLLTNAKSQNPYAELTNGFGSFGTRRHTFSFGTGQLNNHWNIEGRLSRIESDGFIDRATADLRSYYFAATYSSKKTTLKAMTFGGKERTYQAWYGVPESRLRNDTEAMLTTAANEGWNEEQTQNLLNSGSRTFNPYFYKNQVDDYQQDHYQLHLTQQLSEALTLNSSLHYTPGKGFYEEYRFDQDLEDYGLSPITIGDSVISSTDLIRRRWLDNDFYGITWAVNYDKNKWNVVFGGGWNRYDGDHFGEIVWAEVSPVPHLYRYYFNNGDKRDFNSYVKINRAIGDQFNAYVDLQYRQIDYQVQGLENEQYELDLNTSFQFFNPKAGITWAPTSEQQFYASYAVANREPVRSDFVDNPGSAPKYETLRNLEIGSRRTTGNYTFNLNYYYMHYDNQLVLTGALNDVGAPVRTNVDNSYRMGIEGELMWKLSNKWQWMINATWSRNKIRNFTEVLYDYGPDFDDFITVERNYRNTDISFSPEWIAGSTISFFPVSGAEISLLSKYVGDQYLDNTSNERRTLDAFFVQDVRFNYSLKPSFMREMVFSVLVNNLLDEQYESNGYTWGYLAGAFEARENYYYPQAGRNFMIMLTLKI